MKIKIGGHRVKVKIYEHFATCVSNIGTCDPGSNTINLTKTYDQYKLCEDKYIETLLHEVLHFVDYVYCDYVMEECDIKNISKYLFYVFNRNDLFNLPTKVDIVGFNYNIKYSHKFLSNTEGTYVSFSTVDQTISINNTDNMCDDYIKVGLLVGVLKILYTEFIDSKVFLDVIPAFAQGVFQVISDNKKLRKMFKWGK